MGTWFIRLFGYPVFLEGNLIDMGQFKLAVVEAWWTSVSVPAVQLCRVGCLFRPRQSDL